MGRFACVVAVLAVAVACNFHYALLGSSALTGLMGSSGSLPGSSMGSSGFGLGRGRSFGGPMDEGEEGGLNGG